MIFPVTITSQGQITIPAKIRRKFGFTRTKKLLVRSEENKLIIESLPDIMDLSGSLAKHAIKNKPIDEIIQDEKKAVAEVFADRYRRKMKKLIFPT